MYSLVLFDFDGTLADTSLGIINSHRYAHTQMGREIPTERELHSVIGGPLLQTYQTKFQFSEADAKMAVNYYRQYYAESGIYEMQMYAGIYELLKRLAQANTKVGIASLKAERFLKIMAAAMNIDTLVDVIHGVDDSDTRTKADLIRMCAAECSCSLEDTVLIGDSIFDYLGAMASGVDFLGVNYGFGFPNDQPEDVCVVSSPEDIWNYLNRT